jgi:hypothetical protein
MGLFSGISPRQTKSLPPGNDMEGDEHVEDEYDWQRQQEEHDRGEVEQKLEMQEMKWD